MGDVGLYKWDLYAANDMIQIYLNKFICTCGKCAREFTRLMNPKQFNGCLYRARRLNRFGQCRRGGRAGRKGGHANFPRPVRGLEVFGSIFPGSPRLEVRRFNGCNRMLEVRISEIDALKKRILLTHSRTKEGIFLLRLTAVVALSPDKCLR